MPSQPKRKTSLKGKATRWIALTLAVMLLGSVLLTALLSNLYN
jgi:hypothetical protein